jgi:ABC-type transport system involved in multi-copper enzyme maturation permease subunit
MNAAATPVAPAASPSFATASLRVFDLSLGQMLWSRRTVFMGLVVGGPVLIALLVTIVEALAGSGVRVQGVKMGGPAIFGMMIWIFYLRFTVPVLAVFYGTSLIADEVEDKTITYLFTRPVPRGAVLVGKYLAYLACTLMVVLPSVVLVYLIIVPRGGSLGEAFPSLLADLGILALGLAVYGAVFALVGALIKRPVLTGLAFVFGWEPIILVLPGYLKKFTVAHYLQALVPHTMPADNSAVALLTSLFKESPSLPASFAVLAAILIGSLWLATRAVEQREFVLEQ